MLEARLRRGMTQAELAQACRKLGVSASDSQLSKIERGLFTPRPALRAALARILDLDVTKVGKA
jgi:transcriptional regulator with XRE-family HTH domain